MINNLLENTMQSSPKSTFHAQSTKQRVIRGLKSRAMKFDELIIPAVGISLLKESFEQKKRS